MPTIAPSPTPPAYTFDDQEIAKIIETSAAEVSQRLDLTNAFTDEEVAAVFRAAGDWASNQQLRVSVFTPSVCTRAAVGHFNQSMTTLQDVSSRFVAWVAAGASGDPGVSGDANEAGRLMRTALNDLSMMCFSAIPGATSTAGPTPTPFHAPPLLSLSGNGIKSSAEFTTTAPWTLTYSFDCAAFGTAGNFQVILYRGADLVNIEVNELATSGQSSTAVYDTGTLHLEMNSECQWTVTVMQP